MTDKQQPPKRIWIDGEAHRIMGQGSYFTEPYDGKSVEYARVHQIDDARVGILIAVLHSIGINYAKLWAQQQWLHG